MSEYQYYEFQAIDRPLTSRQMGELRKLSTRAEITPTSFTNEYHWGDFRGNPRRMMEQYFDAFFYYANWGTHWFMLRLPKKLVDVKAIKQYGADDHLDVWTKGDFVLLDFQSEDESGEWYGDEGESGLASLIPLRADLLNGDLRALYLGWLAAAQDGVLEADDVEPPVPPGLQRLSASLKSLAEFLRIDDKLLKAAAKAGPAEAASQPAKKELARWIAKLPVTEKNKILLQLAEGNDPHLSMDLLRRFRESAGRKPRQRLRESSPGEQSASCWPRRDWATKQRRKHSGPMRPVQNARLGKPTVALVCVSRLRLLTLDSANDVPTPNPC